MFEFAQLRIAVCRQHFAVGVDVNACSFGLQQQIVEVFQVVAGDQNTLTGSRFHVHLRWGWVTVSLGFARIQNAHHFEVHLADFH
ncbi:hypothetical protein D3C86_1986110 [compost metagenome]